jgi:hypothetical protein
MTESEYLASTDPAALLSWMRRPRGPFLGITTGEPRRPNVEVSDRQLRLWACACCRQALSSTGSKNAESLRLCDLSDRYADGEIDYAELELFAPSHPDCSWPLRYDRNVHITVMNVINAKSFLGPQTALLRDIVANPWRPAQKATVCLACNGVDPDGCRNCNRTGLVLQRWLTPTVMAIARAIYEDRAFDRMPILCDCLEESGCVDAEILAHGRVPGIHVRGCWVLDLLLGRE